MLWFKNRLYLSRILRTQIIQRNHDDSLIDHFDAKKTLKLVNRKYYWLNQKSHDDEFDMRHTIKKYCETCFICKRFKTSRHKSHDRAKSLFIFIHKWVDININFVTKLSLSCAWNEVVYNAILIIVDRLTKMIHYIFVTKTINAKNFVEILIRELVRIHDLLESIIIDKDFVFTSKYWLTLCYALKIKKKLSIAFHSQIDDQTKRQNNIMKQYFRFYINFEQSNWVKLLSMIEFVYNNNNIINAFTNMTFFEANQNYHSRMFFENNQNKRVKSMFAKNNVKHLQNLLNVLKINLMKTQTKQTHYQNERIMFK